MKAGGFKPQKQSLLGGPHIGTRQPGLRKRIRTYAGSVRNGSIISSINIMPWDEIKPETSGNKIIQIKQKRSIGKVHRKDNGSSSSQTEDRGAASDLVKMEVKRQDHNAHGFHVLYIRFHVHVTVDDAALDVRSDPILLFRIKHRKWEIHLRSFIANIVKLTLIDTSNILFLRWCIKF